MKITPLDIRQKQFKSGFRGYDRREVEAFLDLVAAEFEDVIKENLELKETMARKQAKLSEFHEREKTLQETMVTAQRISEDMKDGAKKEAEIIVAEAELNSERIVQNAQHRLVQLVEDINELKRQRSQFESQVRSVVESHLKMLEALSVGETGPRIEENLTFLKARRIADGK